MIVMAYAKPHYPAAAPQFIVDMEVADTFIPATLIGSPTRLMASRQTVTFYLYAEAGPSMRPLFLCHKGDDRYLLSTETACEIGVGPEQTLGFIAPTPLCGATPLYRLYKPEASNHFYTTSDAERNNAINSLGYLDEGILGYIWNAP